MIRDWFPIAVADSPRKEVKRLNVTWDNVVGKLAKPEIGLKYGDGYVVANMANGARKSNAVKKNSKW